MIRSGALGYFSEQLREFAARRAAEALGLITLAGGVVLTLALVSWSARDPSLNHATDGRIRNFLGAPGAIVADLLMQLIGIATIAAILPLAVLGWRLLTNHSVKRVALRLTPLAVRRLFRGGHRRIIAGDRSLAPAHRPRGRRW